MKEKLLNYKEYLKKWLSDYAKKYHLKGFVLGISGGIDSALLASIINEINDLEWTGVYIDIGNLSIDQECVNQLEKQLNKKFIQLNLDQEYDQLVNKLKITDHLAKTNLKVRMRMMTLYSYAQENHALVLGTSNQDELLLGYFTKYGDAACDLMPLAFLNKRNIYQLSRLMNVPQTIIDRSPSASLYEGQTDENDLGVKYYDVDDYLENKKVSTSVLTIIEKRVKQNAHKHEKPLVPNKFIA